MVGRTQSRRCRPRPAGLGSSRRSTGIVLICVVGSVLAHGVAYGVLRQIPKPAVTEPDDGPIYRRRAEPKRPHRVKVVRKNRLVRVRPTPAAMRPAPVKLRTIRRLRPMAPPPRAVASKPRVKPRTRPVAMAKAPPPLDLTASAGVNSRLTAGSGAGGYQLGTTGLGDPTVASNAAKRRTRRSAPRPVARVSSPGPASGPVPTAVYLKRLPSVVAVPRMPYPAGPRKKGIQGTVKLLVTVGASGRAIRVRVLRGLHRALDRLAVRALKQARFRPAMGTDGKPMTYTIRYRYTFRLAT